MRILFGVCIILGTYSVGTSTPLSVKVGVVSA